MNEILLTLKTIPLSVNFQTMRALMDSDPFLNNFAEQHSRELALQDIETFYLEKNLLVTEKGYILITFAEEEKSPSIN